MKIPFIILVVLSFSVQAKSPQIIEILQGKKNPDLQIIKYEDGSVVFKENGRVLPPEPIIPVSGPPIRTEKQNQLLITRPISRDYHPSHMSGSSIYTPTVLLNYATAQSVLNDFSRKWVQGSQCYDRAHVWAFEEYQKFGTNLMKAFLFFSDDYIERYKFPWWFHVAPYSYLKLNNELTERILDPMFSQYPLKFKLWTDLFMKNKVPCKEILNYSEYSQSSHGSDCYLLRATMHYWQPQDLEALEDSEIERAGFFNDDIIWAYDHGFKN